MPYYTVKDKIDPDEIDSPMIGFAFDNYPTTPGEHCHRKGQLLYCSQGVTHFYCQGRYFLLPPSKAAWIPPNVVHDVHSASKVSYRSLYIKVEHFLPLPNTMEILQVEPLLKLMVDKFCFVKPDYLQDSPEFRLATVIVDFIKQAITLPLSLPKPMDKRLNKIFQTILQAPGEAKSVNDYAQMVNITARTLNRITQKEIGLSFEKWRMELRLMHAFVLLERGYSVTQVSQSLGYSNDSSFIARFKQWAGETPAQYRRKVQIGH
ncbi:AraC family transcriptional regulator [Legionella busanensis]|uniref:AraC family transcriptional regulator n=1 Tax=Legionella busanensis TaxID=190655 RepID=A0A378JMQ6_9GAMM|nr:helix-turn-helix transcriptional regulator [Legionella busanensis]STX51479.1 AraC family transcriptional regulator [Legionella busanensis]